MSEIYMLLRTQTNLRVSDFAEADVGIQGEGHEENKSGIKENEPRLCDVTIV